MSNNTNKKLTDRLSRAEGQIKALKRLLQDEKDIDCKHFIIQIKATRSALRAISETYITEHIHKCQKLPSSERDAHIAEAIKLLSN